ncbi:MAG: hypothetical protein KAT88_00740 [Spirochaetes bacterium]|nr:hypothetical protein [Spirochaetota bacterium]
MNSISESGRSICFFIFLVGFSFAGTAVNADQKILDEVVGIDKNGNIESIQIENPKVVLSKQEIYHYDILNVYLYNIPGLDTGSLYMRIFKEGKVHPSAGMVYDIPFLKSSVQGDKDRFKAVYLPSWNEGAGYYEIKLYYGEKELRTDGKIVFCLKRKPLPEIKKGISIVDLETNRRIKERSFTDPSGRKTDYSAILKWAKFMNADALWILAGETTAFKKRPLDRSPWDEGPLENLLLLKELAIKYGIDIGAYVMSFYIPGKYRLSKRYEYGLGYNQENDRLYLAKHISLASEKRIQDIINLVKQFQEDPGITYIGFDFIRTGRADGYELAPAVIDETNIKTPGDWDKLNAEEKIKWFAKKIEVEKDPVIIEKWRWWRAHKVAEIVKRVMKEARVTKPVWVYTLGWNHGKEHGQDPVMFFDAGVSIDAVMLYEANSQQFTRLLNQWNRYIKSGEGNIIIGNCIDYRLLDSDILSPPEELFRRNVAGYRNIIRDGLASGIFLHDIARALWGRRGDFTTKDYAVAYISSVYNLRRDLLAEDLLFDIAVHDQIELDRGAIKTTGSIFIKYNGTSRLKKISIELFSPQDQKGITYFYKDTFFDSRGFEISGMETFDSKRVDFTLILSEASLKNEKIRFRVEIEDDREYYITKLLKIDDPELVVKKK